MISRHYEQDEIPVFLFPVTYAQNQYIPYEKIYNMWIFCAHKADPFLKYTKNLGAIFLRER
jgi:hypothetical protein